jgi:hypothetical protein
MKSEEILLNFLSDWKNIDQIKFIISESRDEITLFTTFEYLNKIFINDKNFKNLPKKENKMVSDEKSEPYFYEELIDILFSFIKSNFSLNLKTFVINSVYNLISQIIRTTWDEFSNPVSLIIKTSLHFFEQV